jgi:hypothetical protein
MDNGGGGGDDNFCCKDYCKIIKYNTGSGRETWGF